MNIYIITFLMSVTLFAVSDKVKVNQRKYMVFFALIIPCIVAGFRAETIGTDVLVYLKPIFNGAINSNSLYEYMNYRWFNIWKYNYVYEYEIGFSLLIYITAKIFKSLFVVQFFIQALTIVPIYMGLKINLVKSKTWIGMLVYFLLMYNNSLNAMRQYIAVAFIFWGIQYVFIGNWKKYFWCQVVAILFHSSGILGIAIMFIYKYLNKNKENTDTHLQHKTNVAIGFKIWIIIAIGAASLFAIPLVVKFLDLINLSRYSGYIMGNIQFMPNQIINRLPMIVLFILFLKKLHEFDRNIRFYFVMFFFELVCLQFTSVNAFGGRIATYFSIFSIISYSVICKIKTNGISVAKWITIAYLWIYWWYYYVYSGVSQTVPYIFGKS